MIKFGKYYKSDSISLEAIEWDILYKDNMKALLLSKYVIDARAWNNTYTAHQITWNNCSLRNWLNDDFLGLAFNSEERNNIILTNNFTKDAKRLNNINMFDTSAVISGGPNSKDYVFLLSSDEILKYFTKGEMIPLAGPDTAFKMKNLTSQATPYAIKKGLYFADNNDDKSMMWWLRSPGGANGMASNIIMGNILYVGGEITNDETVGVRPAIWVKIDALLSEEEKCIKIEQEKRRQEQEERLKKEHCELQKLWFQRQDSNLCQHCGGKFKGLLKKVCKSCGKEKDY